MSTTSTTPPILIDLPKHELGDRWAHTISIGPVVIDDAQPVNALTRVRMRFYKGASEFIIDSDPGGDASITIDNATTWEASIGEIETFLSAVGIWEWDMKFYENGKTNPLTLYHGHIEVTDL